MTRYVPQGCPLSSYQLSALQGLARGWSYSQIAKASRRNISTIRSHLYNVYEILGVHDRAQAVLKATEMGWVEHPDLHGVEIRVLIRLEQMTGELCRLIEERQKLTYSQRAYLSAFDALLYARSDRDYMEARKMMDEALTGIIGEARLPAGQRRKRDLVELLVGFVTARQPELAVAA